MAAASAAALGRAQAAAAAAAAGEEDWVVCRYGGHRNCDTVKGVAFMGERDEWVVSSHSSRGGVLSGFWGPRCAERLLCTASAAGRGMHGRVRRAGGPGRRLKGNAFMHNDNDDDDDMACPGVAWWIWWLVG